jgi:hypothetical protein
MTLTLIESAFTYRSELGGEVWQFTVVNNQNATQGIREQIGPFGLVQDTQTQIPGFVLDDQSTAKGQVENLLAQTSAINGILTFAGETSKTVTFSTPMVNTNYRVVLSVQDFVPFRILSKLATEFTVEAGITFTGSVGFDVFV